MTKKRLAAAAFITLTGMAIALIVWLTATTQGARWLLSPAIPLSGISFSTEKVEGRIIDHLLLRGVRVGLAHQKLELDTLELRWKPLLLLTGTIAAQELLINGVRIQDDAPPDNKPPDLSWPRVPKAGQLFDGRIMKLRVTNLSYRHLQEQPLQITSMAGSVTWQDDHLSVTDLTAESPLGRIAGSASAGFRYPSLTSDLDVILTQPLAQMNRFSLKTSPDRSAGPEPFAGSITLAGGSGTRKLLELSGDVGLAKNALNLRSLRLTMSGRKGVLTGDGSLAFTARDSLLSLKIKAAGLDLAPELNMATDISGTLTVAGTLDSYRGDFTLVNQGQGWRQTTVTAVCQGTRDGMRIAPLNARLLDGTLAGNLDMEWRDGFVMHGVLNGRDLNPARLAADWKGVANFNAAGNLAWSAQTALSGSVSATLLESRLHGQELTGDLQADFAGDNLSLTRLALHGKGFDLHASGELDQRLALTARVSDFSRLIPGAAGTLQSEGWLRWHDRQLSGAIVGTGSRLAYAGTRIAAANLNARLDPGPGYPMHVAATLRDVLYQGYSLNAVTLAADGTLERHTLNATLRSGDAEARLNLAAGYTGGVWQGELSRLAGRDVNGPWTMTAPAAFAVSSGKLSLSPLALTAGTAEHLDVAVDLTLNPLLGQVRANWSGLNLARANPWLKDMRITGKSHGSVRMGFLPDKRLTLAGSADGSGTFSGQGRSITIQRSLLNFDGSEQGLRVTVELATTDGGRAKGTFTSKVPFRLVVPEKGELAAEVSGIDMALLKPWLPADTGLEGHISGRASGSMLPEQRFELNGTAQLSGGTFHQQRPDGELLLAFSSANASWEWRREALSGTLSLTTVDHGQLRASFQLPLAARFPVAVNPGGPLQASLVGQVQEKGIITTLFPGLVQESSGALDTDLVVNGTWETPQITGKLRLSKAGAFLPTAGIHLKDVQLEARLEKNLIFIDSFKALSGAGHVEGTALLTLDGWRVTKYQGTVSGENFQTVNFPELQIRSSPKLRFEGTPQKLVVRGELSLPELNIVGTQSRTVIAPSSDVIREGRVAPPAGRSGSSPLALDVQIRLVLGDKVYVKASGIDAQLGGALDLSFNSLDRITSAGEVKVVKGKYRTYGVNLDIVRGRLFFAGGPIERPALDFLALRTIGDVRAGVTVTGTLKKPITKLYSEPAMPDVDVLAYIVLGHPLGSSTAQASLLVQAAGALLTSSQAGTLQEKIKNQLGLSTLEIKGGVGGTPSVMGYKPLQVTAPGAIPTTQQPGITETVLTVGKYLTPQFYVSYGKSLFTGSSLFMLRYDIFKHWQIETQTGIDESGADLYYKIEFK
ncbi:MAG: translocation/assembly module TamB domain-containing protein [Desulfuromonadales bacterium]|nr:translocation/assembly module TamB domain-containing protein [Desulfuromonadales bacterium]